MKSRALWRISLITSAEAEDAATEVLSELLQSSPAVYYDCETRLSTLSVYLTDSKVWNPKVKSALSTRLAGLKDFGLATGPMRLRFQKVRKEDWAESWKRHFKPLRIGQKLVVRPSWIKPDPKVKLEIVLDPGLSFGTGQHPTTEFCLRQLAGMRDIKPGTGFLDIGTGTGILAIAAAKLGFKPVDAFDFDPEAVHVAEANARKNRTSKLLHLYQADLTKLPSKSTVRSDVICANLTSNLLIGELDRILARLNPGGSLILAGILATEFESVRKACTNAGLVLVKDRAQKEWHSGHFLRK